MANDFIPRLWAARQIGSLTRQIRLEGASSSLVEQVRELGLRYGILTEYTSYLVQEPTDIARPVAPVPLREDQLGGARNSASQTGTGAFEQARASAKLADSKSLAATESAASDRLETLSRDRAAPDTRRAGGRLFIRRGQVWTDVGHADRITVTDVAAYSKAYFELVRQLPEVARFLSVGDEILIAGRQASVRIGPSGVETWQPGQLAALVRNFRGT
jgi:Ca-activated chloride channel family protein